MATVFDIAICDFKQHMNQLQIAMGSPELEVPIWNFKFNLNRQQIVTGSKTKRT
jgi:hypothetical protein